MKKITQKEIWRALELMNDAAEVLHTAQAEAEERWEAMSEKAQGSERGEALAAELEALTAAVEGIEQALEEADRAVEG